MKKVEAKLTAEQEADRNEELLEYTGRDEVVPARLIWNKVKLRGPKTGVVKSGIGTIDINLGGGFFPGQLITVSGPTGRGKTTLLRSLTKHFVAQGVAPLWFSYEETDEQFLSKLPEALYDYMYMPTELTDKKPEWLEQRIVESKLKFGTRVVLVDHLHFLIDFFMKNSSLEIGSIVRKLKILAIKHRIIFFLVAHVGKADRTRELGQGDIRDSAMIEAESDAVFYVWRSQINNNDTNVIKCTKNREGGTIDWKVYMHHDPATKMLYQIEHNDTGGH